MIVPDFKVSQTNEDIIVNIFAPCIRPEESDIYVDNTEFLFYSGPYFLRLNLPGSVLDTEDTSGFYDNDKMIFTVRVKKKNIGEVFENLGSLKPSIKNWNPNEYVNDSVAEENVSDDEVEEEEDQNQPEAHEVLEEVFQPVTENEPVKNLNVECQEEVESPKYGFGNFYSNMFGKYFNEFSDIIDLPNPDRTNVYDRRVIRMSLEDKKFSDDHYLADTMETEEIEQLYEYKPYWYHTNKEEVQLSDEDVSILDKLPVKDVSLLNSEAQQQIIYQLVDILLSYCYNVRTTEGENTVESAWTINKLSATLTFFQTYVDLKDVLITFYRRCLCFPLYRNFDLVKCVQNDLVQLLKSGPCNVTKCLLDIGRLFDESEQRHVLNRLFIHDFCVYTRTMTDLSLIELSSLIENVKVEKEELNFDIPILEIAAVMVLKQSKLLRDTDEVIEKIKQLQTVDEDKNVTCTSSSTSSSSSSESTDDDDDDD